MADEPMTREAVAAEVQKAATDPNHAQHQNYTKNPTEWGKWADSLYKRIPGATGTPQGEPQKLVSDTPAPGVGGMTDTEAATLRQNVATLVTERGVDHKATLAEGGLLFAGKDGEAFLDLLESRTLPGLAPKATIEAHLALGSWLADLNKLRSSGGGADAAAGDDVGAAVVAALQAKGIKASRVNEMASQLFAGNPNLYSYAKKHLDSMPPGARIAAYVRSAEALITLQRLYQSQS